MTVVEARPSVRFERFAYVVVNVSDLERSVAFYEATLPLRAAERFTVRDQRLNAFGVERGSYRGCVLRGTELPGSCAVHLVEWLDPRLDDSPVREFHEPGLYRLAFHSPTVEARYEDVLRAGGRPFTAPLKPAPGRSAGRPVFGFRDPDGTVLEYVTLEGPERIYHVNHNTVDLAGTSEMLVHGFGLEQPITFRTDVPGPCAFTESTVDTLVTAGLFRIPESDPPAAPGLFLDVCQWRTPPTVGRAHYSQHALGLARLGVEVAELAEAQAGLATVPGVRLDAPLDHDGATPPTLLAHVVDDLVLEFVERANDQISDQRS